MHKNYLKLFTVSAFMVSSSATLALPFITNDPRSMAMGGTGVAIGDPAISPFFNPAMLSSSDKEKKYTYEALVVGANIIAPVQTLTDLGDNGNLLTNSINSLSASSTTLSTDTTTLNGNLTTINSSLTSLNTNSATLSTNISAINTSSSTLTSLTSAQIAAGDAAATLNTLSTQLAITGGNLTTVGGNLTTAGGGLTAASTSMTNVGTDMNAVSTNATPVQTNIDKVNATLQALNNKPIQANFSAATVVGVPGQNWGGAFYANGWTAFGGALVYRDAATVTGVTTAIGTISPLLASSGTAISNSSTPIASAGTSVSTAGTSVSSAGTTVTAASTAVTTAANSCTSAAIIAAGSPTVCQTALTAANTALTAANTALATANTNTATAQTSLTTAQTSLTATSNTLTSNATTASTAATNAAAGKTLQSKIHLRGVVATEMGFALSRALVTSGHAWSLGFTPKIVQMQLFDAEITANSGSSSNLTADDFVTKYNSFNFDLGVAKSYNNGWRTGLTVKNVIPQSFDFMSIASGAPTGSAKSVTGQLNINPQIRTGISHENAWSLVAFDLDLSANNPAGLENKSQFAALGGELSAWGWAQLRMGYRVDLQNSDQALLSMGIGISPRIPYFKPHLDFVVAANPEYFSQGVTSASQIGASIKFGFNF